jgi:hypothetical protein
MTVMTGQDLKLDFSNVNIKTEPTTMPWDGKTTKPTKPTYFIKNNKRVR